MANYQELVETLTWLLTNRVEQKINYTHGLLGDGNGRVRVSTEPGSPEVDYVFVRPDRFSKRAFKVFNKRVEGQDGDPVIIGELPWNPGLIQVVDIDWETYHDVGWGDDVTTTSRHGRTHQWLDGAPGLDTFNVYRRQLGDLKTYPAPSGTLNVGVSAYSLDIYGTQYQWAGTEDFSLSGALPTTTGSARMALVYWSPASGTSGYLDVATGTTGLDSETTILNRPATPQGAIPSAFVRLAGGQSSITEFDIWDAREPFRPGLSFGTGTTGLSADMIPISDVGLFYTGSTVESALQELPGGVDTVKVSKLWRTDLSTETLEADASGNMTLNGTGTFGIGTATPGGSAAVEISRTSAESVLRVTTTGAGDFLAGVRLATDDSVGNFFSYDDGYTTVPEYAGKSGFQSNKDLFLAAHLATREIQFYAGNRTATKARIDSDGQLGVGSGLSPLGQFHTYDAISGFMLWEYDGLDATVRTIIPNAAGDVAYRLHASYVFRDSAGAVASGTTDVSNGASVGLAVGTNTVTITVQAGGRLDIARTAGADTIKVALTLRWL